MDIKPISNVFAVTGQIAPGDLEVVKAAGYRAIICNRPDGEGPDQPSFEKIEAAAKAAGLEVRYIPVQGGQITDEYVAEFGAALQQLPRPVLAYCRTGARSSTLWALNAAESRSMPAFPAATEAAG